MEAGLSKRWTEEQERFWARRLSTCHGFAERHMTMLIRDVLKYDGRSKESKRAVAQARLRLTVATDEDLKELAELQVSKEGEKPGEIPGLHRASLAAESLGLLKNTRTEIKEKGINVSEIRRC